MSVRSPTFISISNAPPRGQVRQSDGPSLRGHLPFGQSAVTSDRVANTSSDHVPDDRTHTEAKQFHCNRYILAGLNAEVVDFNDSRARIFIKFVDLKFIYLSGEKLVGCSRTLFNSRKYGLPLP